MSQMTIQKDFEYFLRNDFNEFEENEWVAIFDKKIIAHGKILKKVVEKAKKIAPNSSPLFIRIRRTARYL